MSLIHDIIKINMVREGYLLKSTSTSQMSNYPYHLISDEEMCDAFLNDSGNSYFDYYYPCISESLREPYEALKSQIQYHLNLLKQSDSAYSLPNWVYSYMLKSTISVRSDPQDIHDMLVMMSLDNRDDIFTSAAAGRCYEISSGWVVKYPIHIREHRPPTIFGEPHVIKSLRLNEAAVGGV